MRQTTQFLRLGFLFGSAALSLSACGLLIDLPEPVERTEDINWGGNSGEGSGGHWANLGGSGSASLGGDPFPSGGGMTISGGTGGMGGALLDGCLKHCDCDDDGALAKGACGGDDCDDADDRAFPGQTEFFDERSDNSQVGFDFDCSGQLERPEGQQVALKCQEIALLACEDGQGFLNAMPSCGNVGPWGSCYLSSPVTCVDDVADEQMVASCH